MTYPTQIVSANSNGTPLVGYSGIAGTVSSGVVSGDVERSGGIGQSSNGRFVVFVSEATVGESGNNSARDIFLKDMATGTLSRVFTGTNGTDSSHPTVSDDGKYVTLQSGSLIYRVDMQNPASPSATVITNDGENPHMSANGRFVVYTDDNQIYLRDMDDISNAAILISQDSEANIGNLQGSDNAFVSNDGLVVFESFADNFVDADGNSLNANTNQEVFLKNYTTGELLKIAETADGAGGSGTATPYPASKNAMISGNGRYVVFESTNNDLTPISNVNGNDQINSAIYRKDLLTGKIDLVSVGKSGEAAVGSIEPSISADGRFVLFNTGYGALGAQDGSLISDAIYNKATQSPDFNSYWYLKDMATGDVYGIDVPQSSLTQGFGSFSFTVYTPPTLSYNAIISADGKSIVLSSIQGLNSLIGNVSAPDNQFDVFRINLPTSITNKVVAGQTQTGSNDPNVGDTLVGGMGPDKLVGLDGDDTYIVEIIKSGSGATAIAKLKDTVVEALDKGKDTIELIGSVNDLSKAPLITIAANVENLDASGTDATLLNITGNALNNIITGNNAANILNGGAGTDTLIGGDGDDTYVLDQEAELSLIDEDADKGVDLIQVGYSNASTDSLIIDLNAGDLANIEYVTIIGTGLFDILGNDLNNKMTGNASANLLDGGAGDDTLIGGAGNDTYVVDSSVDVITELANGGIDTVRSSFTYDLTAPTAVNLENITLIGNANLNATGNAGANWLVGNDGVNSIQGGAGNDTLDGGLGVDILLGGAGNDLYIVDEATEVVTEDATATGGIDTIKLAASYNDVYRYIENFVENIDASELTSSIELAGNALANAISGGAGDDTLEGAGGVDVLKGGGGSDEYRVNLKPTGAGVNLVVSIEDAITELADEGEDTVRLISGPVSLSKASTITLGLNLEKLDASATGLTKLNLTGNSLDNDITGNDEANLIDGGTGADQMTGGLGEDTYVVDHLNDTVIEQNGEGDADNIQVKIALAGESYTLSDEVENGALLNSVAFNLTGNILANKLSGNAAANVLDGGLGIDTMIGAAGNDTYIVDNVGDVVTELAAGGIDTVISNISYDLRDTDGDGISGGNVENLTLTESAFSGVGNALANYITGNDIDNLLAGIEGNDTLDGGLGADRLIGGDGNDTYIVDNVGDVVEEDEPAARGGIDIVLSSVTFSLDANSPNNRIENLTLTGDESNDIDATGNDLANIIVGNDGDNFIDGAAGIDLLKGGLGDDTYIVDIVQTTTNPATARVALQDSIVELAAIGNDGDTVQLRGEFVHNNASTFTLALNLENLHANLTGMTKLNINGNTLNNRILGNNAANIINGLTGDDTIFSGAGNDVLDGGTGIDSMEGGDGDDIFMVDNGDDIAVGGADNDTVKITTATPNDIYILEASVENAILLNKVAFTLVGNALANTLTGNIAANTLDGGDGDDTMDGGAGIDTMFGGDGNDFYIVDHGFDEVIEGLGEGTDTVQAKVSYSIADSGEVENLTLLAGAAISATGNSLANSLLGNAAANILDGGEGADAMSGGLGNDIYIVDNENDTVTEALNEGTDTVKLTA
ncbi:MAG: hypothetical protein ACAH10_15040, partial [Methylophilaceae bacterium]